MNMFSYILLGCCIVLALMVIALVIRLKKVKKTAQGNVSEKDIALIVAEEKLLLDNIEQGLKNREFKMYLQFSVDSKTKKLVSAEALSRWEKSDGEILFPGQYIGIMEKFGFITSLDYYMFEMACRKLAEWQGTEFDDIAISCNFTRITISEKDFISMIREISDRYPFDRYKLQIEITEDSIEKNLDIAMKNILWAKELGFTIALDDIGSGYTSLKNLCEYPIDIVKIDRAILLLANEEKGKKLFRGIISLAHSLNLQAVCEGVETEEQNTLVSESDCDFIQGWYYSKALPEDKAEEFAMEYISKL